MQGLKKFAFLLPKGFRPLGIVLTGVGIILAIIRFFFGYKPEFLKRNVFAIYSHYLGSKFMQVIKNQLLEEVAGVFFMLGLFFIAFAREKNEDAKTNEIRLRAFFIAAYANVVFVIISLLFTFGIAFMYMVMANMALWLIVYILSFRRMMAGHRKSSSTSHFGENL
jgi:small-conductance mechanosensitive channel